MFFLKENSVKKELNLTKYDEEEKTHFSLNTEQEQFVRDYFKQDFELWEKMEKSPQLFRKVV